jgi:very-short-patch-repair endonuclease
VPPKGAEEECGQKSLSFPIGEILLEGKAMERNKKLNGNAKEFRKNMTKEEAHLWYQFLCRYPLRFRRQYVVGNYITDFYCHQAKLVVELDGSQHYSPEEREYDNTRTSYLEQQGLQVLRFSNLDVLRQFQNVCTAIDMVAKERTAVKP